MLLKKEKILEVLKGLTQAVEADEITAMGMAIDAEFEKKDFSDSDEYLVERIDTGIRILTFKYDSGTIGID